MILANFALVAGKQTCSFGRFYQLRRETSKSGDIQKSVSDLETSEIGSLIPLKNKI